MEESTFGKKPSQDQYLRLGRGSVSNKGMDRLDCEEFGEMLKKTLCFDYTRNGDYIAETLITKYGLFMNKINFVINLYRKGVHISTLEFTIGKNRVSKAKLIEYDGSRKIKQSFDVKLQREDIRDIYYDMFNAIHNRSRGGVYKNLDRILSGIDSDNKILNLYKELIRSKY